MSPLKIEIMLWHYAHGEDHPNALKGMNAWVDAFRDLLANDMLSNCNTENGMSLRITERGRAYVDFLMSVPLPVQRWEVVF